MCAYGRVYIHALLTCKNVVLRGAISYFLATW